MAFPIKPTVTQVQWTGGEAEYQIEPSSGKKATGWLWKEKPPFEWMNWLFHSLGSWMRWAEDAIDDIHSRDYITSGVDSDYDTLALALAAVQPGQKILVVSGETVNSTLICAQNDVVIEFKPGITMIAGAVSLGMQFTGLRNKLLGGRWLSFPTAIEVTAGATATMIRDVRFSGCTTTVNNLNGTSDVNGCIEE